MPHEKVLGSSRQSYRGVDFVAMMVIQKKGSDIFLSTGSQVENQDRCFMGCAIA